MGELRTVSSRPGEVTPAKAARTRSRSSGPRSACAPPRNASTAASAQAALWAWWAPSSGRNRSSYSPARPRTESSWPPTAMVRERTPNSRPSRATSASTSTERRSSTSAASTGCWASTPYEPGLRIPAFSAAICSIVEPRNRVWSTPIGVMTATCASATLVASQVPPRPTSTTATSTGASAKAANAIAVSTSKNDRRTGVPGVDQVEVGSHVVVRREEPLRLDRPAVEGDPLRHRVQVRAGEPTGPQAELAQQRVDHPGGGGLAVGAGDVHDRCRGLR